MKTSARGWLFAAAGLGAVLLGLAGLVPDWRARLGLAPAPEVTAGAGGETAAPAQTAVAPAPAPAAGDSATGTAEAPAGAAPAETVAADAAPAETVPTGATPVETAPAEGAPAEATSTETASTEAAPAEAAATAAVPGDTAAAESAATGTAAGESAADDAGPAADADAAPAFDLVRVDPAGEAVIAGTARPGAEVEVLVDGIVVASTVAGGDGSFVALASLGRSDRARALQLRHAGAAQTAAVDAAAVEVVTAAATPQADAGDAAAAGAAAGSVVPQGEAAPAGPAEAAVAEASAAATGETPLAETAAEPTAAEAKAEPATAEPAQAALSAPVVILPSPDAAEAPVLVAPAAESVAVLQPAAGGAGRVALDRITYSPGGDAVAAGRARPGHAVRAYANAIFVADAAVAPDGTWQVTLPRAAAEGAHLLRFDEVAANGEVASRLEMPFAYDDGAAPVAARQRQIVVQRGDNLWRIAEQHYGQGLRYSVIFGANAGQIRDPDLIYPGQVFAIPELIATE